jgi:hypothetical protein
VNYTNTGQIKQVDICVGHFSGRLLIVKQWHANEVHRLAAMKEHCSLRGGQSSG